VPDAAQANSASPTAAHAFAIDRIGDFVPTETRNELKVQTPLAPQ